VGQRPHTLGKRFFRRAKGCRETPSAGVLRYERELLTSMENQSLFQKIYDLGFAYERDYRGCAQSAIAALLDGLGIRNPYTDAIFKSATGLSGGVGSETDGSCGAYLGGAMIIAYHLGRERENFADPEKIRVKTSAIVSQLHSRFIAEYGTVTCNRIHTKIIGRPFYIKDLDEREKFEAAGAHRDKCTRVVGLAAAWTAEILGNEGLLND
jgi:C_GCAxxG_C_C family probable redox protein